MIEPTETGYRIRCACGTPRCTAVLNIETYPNQDRVIISIDASKGTEMPFRLSDLRKALDEERPAAHRCPRCGSGVEVAKVEITGRADLAAGRQSWAWGRWEACTGCGRTEAPELVDGDAPSRPLSAPVAAQEPPVGGTGPTGGVETISVVLFPDCDCGHEGLVASWHLRPCPVAERRNARRGLGPRCTCPDAAVSTNQPDPACPRHGAVI